jgi:hypothetical protein
LKYQTQTARFQVFVVIENGQWLLEWLILLAVK